MVGKKKAKSARKVKTTIKNNQVYDVGEILNIDKEVEERMKMKEEEREETKKKKIEEIKRKREDTEDQKIQNKPVREILKILSNKVQDELRKA